MTAERPKELDLSQFTNNFKLAHVIREPGESWQSAIKRAADMLHAYRAKHPKPSSEASKPHVARKPPGKCVQYKTQEECLKDKDCYWYRASTKGTRIIPAHCATRPSAQRHILPIQSTSKSVSTKSEAGTQTQGSESPRA